MKTLIQASTLNALMLGNFDRTISIKDFLHHADTGIGTYTGLDGEAIFEDGVAYKATADGKVTVMKPENGVAFDDRHIVEDNPTAEELKAWWEKSGLPLKKFFNTSGLVYKEQNLKERLPDMSEEEQLALLATNGMLVKRPLVIGEDFVLIGFKEAEWERLK